MKLLKFLIILLVITLPLTIIFTNARFLIYSKTYYQGQFAKNNIYSQLPEADLILENLTEYFKSDDKLVVSDMTKNEIEHMGDVKVLINRFLKLYYILFAIDAVLLFFVLYTDKKAIRFLLLTTALVIVGLGLIAFILSASFETFFSQFHLMFFPQGNYIFPANSILIRLFPQSFFNDIFIAIFLRSLVMAAIFLALFVVLNKRKKK